MDINLTIIGEMLTFAVLIFFTLKYVWPPLIKAMQDRQEKIAAGLAVADRAQHNLEIAQQNAKVVLQEARGKANDIVDNAERQVIAIVEAAKDTASKESLKILATGRMTLENEKNLAAQALQKDIADLAVAAVKKLLQDKIDARVDQELIDKFIGSIEALNKADEA